MLRLLASSLVFVRALSSDDQPAPFTALPRPYYDACIAPLVPRLLPYCNNPPPLRSDAEGASPVPGARLVHVHAFFRHGDRSAIHSIPSHMPIDWPCEEPNDAERLWASAALAPLHSSAACSLALRDPATSATVRIHPSTGVPLLDGEEPIDMDNATVGALPTILLPRECVATSSGGGGPEPNPRVTAALARWHTARKPGQRCHPEVGGELSSVGWAQLVSVGKGLADAYARPLLLRDDPASEPLRVLTTDTGRTALSATAVVRGLLQGASEAAAAGSAVGSDAGSAKGQEEQQQEQPRERSLELRRLQLEADAAIAEAALNKSGSGSVAAAAAEAPASVGLWEGSDLASLQRAVPQLRFPIPLHVVNRSQDASMWARRHTLCPAVRGRLGLDASAAALLLEHEHVEGHVAEALHASGRLTHARRSREAAALEVPAHVQGPPPKEAAVAAPKTEHIADDLFTRLCHGLPLPCSAVAADDADAGAVAALPDPAAVCPPEDGLLAAAILRQQQPSTAADALHNRSHSHHQGHPHSRGATNSSGDGAQHRQQHPHQHCMRVSHAAAVLARADALYGRVYETPATGLLLYPLLSQVMGGEREEEGGVTNCSVTRAVYLPLHRRSLAACVRPPRPHPVTRASSSARPTTRSLRPSRPCCASKAVGRPGPAMRHASISSYGRPPRRREGQGRRAEQDAGSCGCCTRERT